MWVYNFHKTLREFVYFSFFFHGIMFKRLMPYAEWTTYGLPLPLRLYQKEVSLPLRGRFGILSFDWKLELHSSIMVSRLHIHEKDNGNKSFQHRLFRTASH